MERTLIDNRYELGEPLGGGGMARVYLARDRLLERDVAVKILREQYAEDSGFVERFRREAQNAAALSHPHIVQTYDRGETGDGRYYIAMEHVSGGTLSERLDRDGTLAAHTAAEVASQVADALGAAHEQRVIHRDIKPQNVLVTERGDVKVTDFGIARAAEETSLSRTSAVLGTAAYMSPEQALGKEVGPTGDLYSLGVVLYEMLTGKVPFTAPSPTAVSLMHVNAEPTPPAELNPEIPESMNDLVMKLLSKDPADRYTGAGELIEDLHRVGEGLHPLNAGNAGAAAGVVAGAAAGGSHPGEPETGVPETPVGTPESAGAEAPVHSAASRRFRRHRRTPLKRFLAGTVLVVALLGAVGWLAWPGSEGPGIAGALEGVPEEARESVDESIEGVATAFKGTADELVEPVTGAERAQVPEVEGLTEEAATQRLQEAGFEAQTRPRQSSAQDAGLVLEQSVADGNRAEEGSTILLAVGTGLPQGGSPQGNSWQGTPGGGESWGGAARGAAGADGGSVGPGGSGGYGGPNGPSAGAGDGSPGSYAAPGGGAYEDDRRGEGSAYEQYEPGD